MINNLIVATVGRGVLTAYVPCNFTGLLVHQPICSLLATVNMISVRLTTFALILYP